MQSIKKYLIIAIILLCITVSILFITYYFTQNQPLYCGIIWTYPTKAEVLQVVNSTLQAINSKTPYNSYDNGCILATINSYGQANLNKYNISLNLTKINQQINQRMFWTYAFSFLPYFIIEIIIILFLLIIYFDGLKGNKNKKKR